MQTNFVILRGLQAMHREGIAVHSETRRRHNGCHAMLVRTRLFSHGV